MLLDLLQQVFPNGGTLQKSHHEAQKMLNDLGLGYISIHACKYDCALFWKEFMLRLVLRGCTVRVTVGAHMCTKRLY